MAVVKSSDMAAFTAARASIDDTEKNEPAMISNAATPKQSTYLEKKCFAMIVLLSFALAVLIEVNIVAISRSRRSIARASD
jgi:hypothetical protein